MIGLAAGFLCPPLAYIDNSVLVAFGEVSTFSAGLIGIDYTYKYKIFMNKNSKNEQSVGRKIGIYVVVGIMTFTMIFSVFAGLVAAMN